MMGSLQVPHSQNSEFDSPIGSSIVRLHERFKLDKTSSKFLS